jgi:phosphoribosylformylglycinamidine synthase
LETLAQTWSEHCCHKTFRALIEMSDAAGKVTRVDGMLRSFIRAATERVARPWVRSAFVDNAGIIDFDDELEVSFKVETHNHPSALEPFGGANTGVGGVVRDVIGVSARPIAVTDVLCFGPQNLPMDQTPEGTLHPRRIKAGVVAGIQDYGNKLGLPTVSGAILYDESFTANPLVFAGCLGLAPKGSHPTGPRVGDLVIVIGGRTGRDGLHGATFSSESLTHTTGQKAGAAVQIGDPITEKDVIEVVCLARDAGLYTGITDCGAGGLSSAVGELGRALGVDVDLADVPLKYPGLQPWEIWLSEAQERMVLAVPPNKWPALRALCRDWNVEATAIGSFTGQGRLVVRSGKQVVADLTMDFLHDGIPRLTLPAIWPLPGRQSASASTSAPASPAQALLALLAHPNTASKEDVIRRYDHEVGAGTLVKPLTGAANDGPSDAAVLKPLQTWKHNRGLVLSLGVNAELGKADPYAMAVSVADEAIRNAVAVGADPDRIALLDNFCWGSPRRPDQLGGLVRAAQGCYDAAVAYGAPFISGKDSLNNEFIGPDGQRTPIHGTLLISALGIIPDVGRAVTMDLKQAGNIILIVGATFDETAGSHAAALGLLATSADTVLTPPRLPKRGLERYRALHAAMQKGLVRACHDLSEGGLGVAAAEMCIAGRCGMTLRLHDVPTETSEVSETSEVWTAETILFSESNGRFLVEVQPDQAAAFRQAMGDCSLAEVGVVGGSSLRVLDDQATLLDLPVADLAAAWQGGNA